MKYMTKIALMSAIILMTGAFLIAGTKIAGAAEGHATAVVTADEVRVQSEPGKHGLLQKILKRESKIKIIKHRQGWIQVLHNGEVGFIKDQAQTFKIVSSNIAKTGPDGPPKDQGQQQQLNQYEKRKEHISREIEQGQLEVEAFTQKEGDTIQRLNQVERALNKGQLRTAAIRKEIKKFENAIGDASRASDKLKKQIRANELYVAQRLVALYKMNWLGRFHLLASAESMHQFIQRKAALERILAHDEKIRRNLISDQEELKKVLSRLKELKEQKRSRAEALKKQIRLMSQEKSTRTELLADIRSQKALELAAIDALTQASNELDRKINLLNTSINRSVPDKNATRLPFSAHKGLLIQPVNGKIISLYGSYKNPKYNITNFRSGIDIKAENGEPVRAVFQGKVLFSSWFKTYGNMIIIDHGKNYYTVYAHLEEIFKAKGDEVETGEVIATVGDTGSMVGAKLYFEVRHHGKPVNPMPWFKEG
jgi:septal ring factor EnvC (AmiA/AmiB activator)